MIPKSSLNTAAIAHGTSNEQEVITEYSELLSARQETDHIILPAGLVVSVSDPWLGASPDGVVKSTQP